MGTGKIQPEAVNGTDRKECEGEGKKNSHSQLKDEPEKEGK